MKSILKIAIALSMVLAISSAGAQVADTVFRSVQPGKPSNINAQMTEYVIMKGGNMMLHEDGKETALAELFNCTDGSKVDTGGTLTKKDGTTIKLSEGDKVYKDGTLVKSGGKD
jgi:hypothetical protein